jgi:glyoxylase-like metal-dependent hydrolase (beta-lactamase superfamily II)
MIRGGFKTTSIKKRTNLTYEYKERMGDVVLIDTHIFGFNRFQSCYLIKGPEITLIDTGVTTSMPYLRKALDQLKVPVEDIAHIFVTHCEHPDHSGNVGALLQENTKTKVYIHPQGLTYLTPPEIESLKLVRGETLYYYLKDELVASCAGAFSKYFQELG